MVRIEVTSNSDHNIRHIESIHLLYESSDTVLLHVDLRTKHKDAGCFYFEDGHQSVWVGNDEIRVFLPESFQDAVMFAETARYTMYICIATRKLVDDRGELLWKKPQETE